MDVPKSKLKYTIPIKIISLFFGYSFAIGGAVALIVFAFEYLMFYMLGMHSGELDVFRIVMGIYLIIMPFMIVLGVAYIIFGHRFLRQDFPLRRANMLLFILSLLLPVLLTIITFVYFFGMSAVIYTETAAFSIFMFAFIFLIISQYFVMFIIPQLFIDSLVKKYLAPEPDAEAV